jgi:hypothetical protein
MTPTKTKPKIQCRGCDKSFTEPYVYQHERKEHGIYGGASGKGRNGNAPTFSTQPKLKVVEGMILLQDDEGGMWVAERIR